MHLYYIHRRLYCQIIEQFYICCIRCYVFRHWISAILRELRAFSTYKMAARKMNSTKCKHNPFRHSQFTHQQRTLIQCPFCRVPNDILSTDILKQGWSKCILHSWRPGTHNTSAVSLGHLATSWRAWQAQVSRTKCNNDINIIFLPLLRRCGYCEVGCEIIIIKHKVSRLLVKRRFFVFLSCAVPNVVFCVS